jgi:hypothetical protein
MAVVEYGTPDLSMEPFIRKRWMKRNSRSVYSGRTWWVLVIRKMSGEAAQRKRGTDLATYFKVLNPDAPWSGQKVIDRELRFDRAVELRCPNTRCTHAPGIKVAKLIEIAQDAVARGVDWIWV